MLSLMSKDFEAFLVRVGKETDLVVGKKHRATDVVQLLISKLRRNKRAFRHHMEKEYKVTTGLMIPRISDTRFAFHFEVILSFHFNSNLQVCLA